jgi:hypothetical protein
MFSLTFLSHEAREALGPSVCPSFPNNFSGNWPLFKKLSTKATPLEVALLLCIYMFENRAYYFRVTFATICQITAKYFRICSFYVTEIPLSSAMYLNCAAHMRTQMALKQLFNYESPLQ